MRFIAFSLVMVVAGCGGETDAAPRASSGGWGLVHIASGAPGSSLAAFISQPKPELVKPQLGTCFVGGAIGQLVGDGTRAGRISVKAGARNVDFSFPEGSAKAYVGGTLDGPLDPNVAIEVHAEGGTVPAFDASLLPVQPLDVTFRIDGPDATDSALELTWDAVRDDPNLQPLTLDFNGDDRYMGCTVDAKAGRFVVPKEQFRELATHPHVAAGSAPVVHFSATPAHSVTVSAGNYEVIVTHTATTAMDIPIP